MPAVIVGHHRHDRVGQLGLAGQLGFRHRGHADHAAIPTAIQEAFGAGRKLRTFHADVSAAFAVIDLLFARRQSQRARQARTDRMSHGHMGDEAGAEEALLPRESAVDELVGHHEGAGRQLFLQRAAGRDRDQIGDADALEGIDIGAIVDRGRRLDMAAAMARQEHQVDAVEGAGQKLIRRFAPRAFDRLPLGVFQARDLVDARTTNDAENGFSHEKGRHP